jgi:hypothetical protein
MTSKILPLLTPGDVVYRTDVGEWILSGLEIGQEKKPNDLYLTSLTANSNPRLVSPKANCQFVCEFKVNQSIVFVGISDIEFFWKLEDGPSVSNSKCYHFIYKDGDDFYDFAFTENSKYAEDFDQYFYMP